MDNKEQIQARMNNLSKEYDELGARIDESNELIKELEDRKLRQREARNVYLARATQIENEYKILSAQLEELNKEPASENKEDNPQEIVIPPQPARKSTKK